MVWIQQLNSHPLAGAILCFGLALVALGLRQLAHHSPLARRLDASFTLITVGLLCGALEVAVRLAGIAAVSPYLDAVFFGALGIGVVRAALTLFVDFYLRQREGAAVSAFVRDVASVVTYFVVIVAVLRSTLDINLASLIATSAVLTAIIGLALQDVLSNLLSGLVLELEAPFTRGDWVRIGSFEGAVEETGWRTTKIRTRVNELVTVPNAVVSKDAVVNYSRPDPSYGETLRFEIGADTPPNLVKETVLGVLSAEPEVSRTPPPEVRIERYGDSGPGYAVRYWISNFAERERICDRVMTNLWYALQRADVRLPFPGRDVFLHDGRVSRVAAGDEITATLRGVSLLEPLDDAALSRLAARVRRLTYGRGEVVVREGEAGDSFYVIAHGEAEVALERGRTPRILGHLHAGGFFGEMSLLAGERRTATVRATTDLVLLVVDREAFKEIISADPALLMPLSEIAAHRQTAQDEHRRVLDAAPAEVDRQQAQRLHERIRAFFRL